MDIKKIIKSFKDIAEKKEKINIVKTVNNKDFYMEINLKNVDFEKINNFFSFQKIK